MPWQETDPMFERHHFAQDLASGQWTMTELCTRYGISRNTGYKWRERFLTLFVGTFRLHNGQQFLTQALNGEMIGLEEVQDGLWNVLYDETLLGRFDEHTRTITGAPSLKNDC